MAGPRSDFHFKSMSFSFKLRDIFLPPKKILAEVGIKPGFKVLDYGCGPGSYTMAVARLVGSSGKVYALDIHPLAIKSVQKIAAKQKLANVDVILSDCATGLPAENLDVVLFYDILHELAEPDKVLAELHRVLKPEGILSLSDHHLKEGKIVARITGRGLFQLLKKCERVYNFSKVK